MPLLCRNQELFLLLYQGFRKPFQKAVVVFQRLAWQVEINYVPNLPSLPSSSWYVVKLRPPTCQFVVGSGK